MLVGAVEVEDLDVARIGRMAVEDKVAERGTPEDLRNEAEIYQTKPHAAVLLWMSRGPQPHLPDLLALFPDLRQELAEWSAEEGLLHWYELLSHELVDHCEHGLGLLAQ